MTPQTFPRANLRKSGLDHAIGELIDLSVRLSGLEPS